VSSFAIADAAEGKREGDELIGKPAPPLKLEHWLNSKPLEISDLRGRVVLVRWWTQGCPFCEATAPALLKLQRGYGDRGFQTLGIYHPKPAGNWDLAKFQKAVQEKQFTFPVALDGDWSALKIWWLQRDRGATSVSFLLDRQGIIRYIHPGGEFHEGDRGGLAEHTTCNREMHAIQSKVVELLS
jgi:peroxiredoxin